MKISYIAPVATAAVTTAKDISLLDIVLELAKGDSKLLEQALSNAINNTIVIPFTNACIKGWVIFVEMSGVITLLVAIAGVMTYIGGVKKGKDVAITCGVIHLIIQLINFFIMRC